MDGGEIALIEVQAIEVHFHWCCWSAPKSKVNNLNSREFFLLPQCHCRNSGIVSRCLLHIANTAEAVWSIRIGSKVSYWLTNPIFSNSIIDLASVDAGKSDISRFVSLEKRISLRNCTGKQGEKMKSWERSVMFLRLAERIKVKCWLKHGCISIQNSLNEPKSKAKRWNIVGCFWFWTLQKTLFFTNRGCQARKFAFSGPARKTSKARTVYMAGKCSVESTTWLSSSGQHHLKLF